MLVVVNVGRGYVIPTEDEEEQIGQPEEQPRQRGRRNVREVNRCNNMGGGPSRDETMAWYFDKMSVSMNWIGDTMENMIQHFNIEQPPNLGNQYPICPSWSEYWS